MLTLLSNSTPTECKLKARIDDQERYCKACERLETHLFRKRRFFLNSNRDPFVELVPIPFHRSFAELENCALRDCGRGSERCTICQVILRACLLSNVTLESVQRLREDQESSLYAKLQNGLGGVACTLDINTQCGSGENLIARLECYTSKDLIGQFSLPSNPTDPALFAQARVWLRDCIHDHPRCSNLKSSKRNPTWLLYLHSEETAQLVRPVESTALVDYCALSYCWGSTLQTRIQDSPELTFDNTATSRFRRRQLPFSTKELSKTLQDAVQTCISLGLYHIWIDAICIDPGTGWSGEASLMHEVYGNAVLTLYTAAASDATHGILHQRDAWLYPRRQCQMGDLWLDELGAGRSWFEARKGRDPLSSRGWICQEERLSPRILYISSQGLYWSCANGDRSEIGEISESTTRRARRSRLNTDLVDTALPQSLLSLRLTPEAHLLHSTWHRILESYTSRNLANPSDRFLALSGMAAQYYDIVTSRSNSSGNDRNQSEEYIAGLWRNTFAADLCWIADGTTSSKSHLGEFAPSWSWASLPLCTPTLHSCSQSREEKDARFQSAASFALLTPPRGDGQASVILEGAIVRRVRVRGRFRSFLPRDTWRVPWEATMWPGNRDDDMSQNVYGLENEGGGSKLFLREAHRQGMYGFLDYPMLSSRSSGDKAEIQVCVGEESGIHCIEIGEKYMLLVVASREQDIWVRVGICFDYIVDFFKNADVTIIELS